MSAHPLDPRNVLPTLVGARAETKPDGIALVDIGIETVTWAQLHSRTMAWADAIAGIGMRRGDRVATMLGTSVDAQAVWLACAWLGVLEVPINTAFHGRMLAHVINDSGARAAVVPSRFVPRFADVAHDTTTLDLVVVVGPTEADSPIPLLAASDLLASATSGSAPIAAAMPWDASAVLYTSGTTGPSKGVLVPWGQFASGIEAFDDCRPGDVLFAPFAPSHLAGKLPLQLMAYWGGTHVFRDGFKTDTFWQDVRSNGCNRVWLFHAMANFVWRQPERDDDADNPIETITGGPLLHEYLAFEKRFGVRMRTNFGMTEAGWPITTGSDVRDPLSCGRPRPGYDLRIVDEHDLEVAEGEIGELLVRSHEPWVMNSGYFERPQQTAEAWRNGWFHTGDAFRRDADGNWFFVDRVKDSIRRRSENISSFEIESLVGECDDILECAAVGVPSEHGEEEIKVIVVAKPGRAIDLAALVADLAERMPSFMVPRYLQLVDDLPKTPTGKVRKIELKKEPFAVGTYDRGAVRGSR